MTAGRQCREDGGSCWCKRCVDALIDCMYHQHSALAARRRRSLILECRTFVPPGHPLPSKKTTTAHVMCPIPNPKPVSPYLNGGVDVCAGVGHQFIRQ